MPLPTSDLRNPVCLEMKTLRSGQGMTASIMPTQVPLSSNGGGGGGGGDIGSVDSSDTYASCNTHPSHSQGDLLDSNLYVNPLDNSPTVKKSASGDTALRSLGASPMEEDFKGFGPNIDRGSRGSLNDTPLPKHRKTRFQQGVKPRTRFGDPPERTSQESLQDNARRRPSFMPSRSIASATRIINQHLFGIQTLGPGKNGGGSKSSLSVDSIDSRTSPVLDQHRRSKSILKKCDSGGRDRDPEMEKLIGSPNRLPPPVSPPTMVRGGKLPIKFVLDDLLEKHSRDEAVVENKHKERLEHHPPPLYICPPPPGDDHSPTEETKLLLHQTAVELLAPAREAAASSGAAAGGGASSRHKHELHTS